MDMSSQIIFNASKSDTYSLIPLPVQFDRIHEAWCRLLNRTFELGQRNPFAQDFMVEADDGYQVSDELSGTGHFYRNLKVVAVLMDDFSKDITILWNMLVDAYKAVPEKEPEDPVWKVTALEHALTEEKAWNEKLCKENQELKAKLDAFVELHPNFFLENAIKKALEG